MPGKTPQLWNRLRSVIKECLTFAEIKDAAGRAGLPLEEIAHLQQRQLPEQSASKSELLDELGVLLGATEGSNHREAISAFTEACVRKHPKRHAEIYREAIRNGFDLNESGELENVGEPELTITGATDSIDESRRHIPASAPTMPSIFVSYSHRDRAFQTQLAKHLKALSFSGKLTFWSDNDILPGNWWYADIRKALDAATVAVLLVSPDFLASDFIRAHEFRPLLQKHENGEIKLLWVPIRACNWEETDLKRIQAVISPSKPLAEMKAERDRAWVKICKAIKAVAGE